MSDVLPARVIYLRVCLRWLSGVLLLAAAWAFVIYMNAPWAASYVMAAAIGWILYRLARANASGIALWCLAVVAVGTTCGVLPGSEADGLMALCSLTGVILLLASATAFLAAALKDRIHRGGNCAGCNLALFTLIAWVAGYAGINSRVRHQDAVQRTTETIIELHKLAAEVESIRARLGRLPNDEMELVALRQKPMPTFYRNFQIGYRLDRDRYYLTCSLSDFWDCHWDLFGWIVSYYGPNAPRRMQIILF